MMGRGLLNHRRLGHRARMANQCRSACSSVLVHSASDQRALVYRSGDNRLGDRRRAYRSVVLVAFCDSRGCSDLRSWVSQQARLVLLDHRDCIRNYWGRNLLNTLLDIQHRLTNNLRLAVPYPWISGGTHQRSLHVQWHCVLPDLDLRLHHILGVRGHHRLHLGWILRDHCLLDYRGGDAPGLDHDISVHVYEPARGILQDFLLDSLGANHHQLV